MNSFEQQVLANQAAIQDILRSGITIDMLDAIQSIGPDDLVAIRKNDNSGTFKVKYSELIGALSAIKWSPISMGNVPPGADPLNNTDEEIRSHINNFGFTINQGETKIIQLVCKQQGSLVSLRYFVINNAPGVYGNQGQSVGLSSLYEFYRSFYSVEDSTEDSIVIDLGDIGISTIEDHINSMPQSPELNLVDGPVYIFKAKIESLDNVYMYVGDKPKQLGSGTTPLSTSSDYELISEFGSLNITKETEDTGDTINLKYIGGNTTNVLNPNAVTLYNNIINPVLNGNQTTLINAASEPAPNSQVRIDLSGNTGSLTLHIGDYFYPITSPVATNFFLLQGAMVEVDTGLVVTVEPIPGQDPNIIVLTGEFAGLIYVENNNSLGDDLQSDVSGIQCKKVFGAEFEADTDMKMCFEYNGKFVEYYFLKYNV